MSPTQADPDLARLELRHRQRARVEDRIRAAKATGLRNLPFDLLRRNAVWLELMLAAQDLTRWAQALLLAGHLAVAEPKTLRYRLFQVAARVIRHARRLIVRLQASWPWAAELAGAFARLRALPLRLLNRLSTWPCLARASPACPGVPVHLRRRPGRRPRRYGNTHSSQPSPLDAGDHIAADPRHTQTGATTAS